MWQGGELSSVQALLTQCALGLVTAPAKQMKETGSTCCLYNKSLEVLQGATSQDTHAVEGRAGESSVWGKQTVAAALIERKCKNKNICNPAQDVVN